MYFKLIRQATVICPWASILRCAEALLLYLDCDFLCLNSLYIAVGTRQNKEQSTIPILVFFLSFLRIWIM